MARCPGWCGECYSNGRGRSNYDGHVAYRRPRKARELRWWEMAMKKPNVVGGIPLGAVVPDKGNLLDGLPTVWSMLTEDAWEDGSARLRSTLLMMCDGAAFKLWLNDKALERSCWVSGESLEHALNALEDLLYTDSAGWRMSGPPKSKKK